MVRCTKMSSRPSLLKSLQTILTDVGAGLIVSTDPSLIVRNGVLLYVFGSLSLIL